MCDNKSKLKGLLVIVLIGCMMPMKGQTVIAVDVAEKAGRVPSLIYGAGMEDVNHEIYGGLYDQRIFGESFEEPAHPLLKDFVDCENTFSYGQGVLRMTASGQGKILYKKHPSTYGKPRGAGYSVEVEVRIDSPEAISGIITNVTEARKGADAFKGYEISVNAKTRHLVIGKHDHNWQPLTTEAIDIDPEAWNRLKVEQEGGKLTVSLNGKKLCDFEDRNEPFTDGLAGLRSFGGGASFRNLVVNGKSVPIAEMPSGVSSMWEPVGKGTYSHEKVGAFHGRCYQKVKGRRGDGIVNFGLNKWGISVSKGEKMTGYLYLKGNAGKVYVVLRSADGRKEYARHEIKGIGDTEWTKCEFTLVPNATDPNAAFAVMLGDKGEMGIDMAMLHTDSFPFRAEITDAFRKEGLNFLRYGGTMVNAPEYMTANMHGPEDLRPPYTGHWYTHSTNGFGIVEFVKFARLIDTEPTFAINIEDNPADVLALLKELEPYGLKYIEIGNEENLFTDAREAYVHYVERFNVLYDAIHPLYPDLVFINAAWWRQDREEIMEYVFRQLDGKAELWDYHPWTDEVRQALAVERDIQKIKACFEKWNPKSTMRLAILEENGNTHSLHRALSHAVMLNIVRGLGGFVELDSPANALEAYLQNDNGWNQGQIFFNSASVWCQPPYYAQQMASAYHQPVLLSPVCENDKLHMSATRSDDGSRVVLHIVNFSGEQQPVALDLSNRGEIKGITGVSLSGKSLADRNTPDNPELIAPVGFTLTEPSLVLLPYSYTIIALDCEAIY